MRSRTLKTRVEALLARGRQPRFIRIVAAIYVHDRRPPTLKPGKCHCCGSPDALAPRQGIPAGDLIIDLRSGERIKAEQVTPSTWAALCEVAKLREIKLRCSQEGYQALTDETGRHIYCSAGFRSGKTTLALNFMVLHWLHRGGPLMRFWLVAPTQARAYQLLQKLILGSREGAGILPRELVRSVPNPAKPAARPTMLVDGSCIELKYFLGDPSAEQLKGDPIVAGVVDEAALLPGKESLAELKGRCADYHGRLFFSSTPRPTTFLRDSIYNPAAAFNKLPDDDPVKISGAHPGAIWNFVRLAFPDNPWMPLDQVELMMRTADMKDPESRRLLLGEWVSDNGLFWEFKFDQDKHVVVHDKRDVTQFGETFMAKIGCAGHVDITGQVVKRLFSGRNPHYRNAKATNMKYILGHDHNYDPMNECVIQVTAPLGKEKETDYWHIWVVGTVQLQTRSTLEHVKHLKSVPVSKTFNGHHNGETPTFEGCGVIADATAVNHDHAAPIGHQRGSLSETYGKEGFDVRAPAYRSTEHGVFAKNPYPRSANYTLIQRLLSERRLHILQNAQPLLTAFAEQEDTGLGEPKDGRAGKWDVIAGNMDAFRYAVYAIMNSHAPTTIGRPTV